MYSVLRRLYGMLPALDVCVVASKRALALPVVLITTTEVTVLPLNPFADSLRAALDALATSAAREAQRGIGHGVSGVQAVERDHAALP